MRILPPIILCLLLLSCDGGLAPPPPVELGFSGTVYFTPGSWPSADSLVGIMIFASKIYPLDSATVFAGLFSNPPSIFIYPSVTESLLPFYADSISYSFPLSSGTYKYIGVVQQISSDLLTNGIRIFRIVGFYKDSLNLSHPGSVIVNDIAQIKNINIQVDFNNPPPQPFWNKAICIWPWRPSLIRNGGTYLWYIEYHFHHAGQENWYKQSKVLWNGVW